MTVWTGEGRVKHVHGVDSRPHVRVVQCVLRAIAIPRVSVQIFREKGRKWLLAGDYGDHRRIKGERNRLW